MAGLGDVGGGVAGGGVAELVRDDAGQLVLARGEGDELAREEDVAARDVEGVGLGQVYQVELEFETRGRKVLDELLADLVEVSL